MKHILAIFIFFSVMSNCKIFKNIERKKPEFVKHFKFHNKMKKTI